MKFGDLDARMRVYETAHDHRVMPGIHIVVRIDGRGFTHFTKEVMRFEAPYDVRFRDAMVETVKHLMDCGFRVAYGYTQSDEISLLLHPEDDSFGRKERKLVSVLAGETSGFASLQFGKPVAFDARVCQLPGRQLVVDYFRWRQEDAARNALHGHVHWRLRAEGAEPDEAYRRTSSMSTADKNEFLFQRGVNFNTISNWQKRGVGVRWSEETEARCDQDPGQQQPQRRLVADAELPMRDEYDRYIAELLETL